MRQNPGVAGSPDEAAVRARGLAAHGLWRHALRAAGEATGLDPLTVARWRWLAGDVPGARAAFERLREERPGDVLIQLWAARTREGP